MTEDFQIEGHALGPVLDGWAAADNSWLAVVEPSAESDWTGTLRVGPPGALEVIAEAVPRGLAGCATTPQKIVFARTHGDPSQRTLWLAEGRTPSQVPLAHHRLDRVLGLDPSCRWVAVTLVDELPVLAVVELDTTQVHLLANHNLAYSPGKKPDGFVSPPGFPANLEWTNSSVQYTSADGPVRLPLPLAEVR